DVKPKPADNRHEVSEVRDLVTKARQEACETNIEDRLQNDDRDDEHNAPCDDLEWRNDRKYDDHDEQSRHEIEKVAHDGRDRQSSSRKLEALDHRRARTDRTCSTGHAL